MYSCPNCGNGLKFDIPSQSIYCDHCDSHFDPYQVTGQNEAEEKTVYNATIFTCPQCGGEILSTDNTAANFCSFCGASTVLTSRLEKCSRPDYIIPFQLTKEDCKKAYLKKIRHAIYAPSALKNAEYIDEFRGIYMPYWTYHVKQQGEMDLRGKKTYRRGDYVITDHYDLTADLNCSYQGLSKDASSSFDDSVSDRIAPYDVRGMQDFTPSYLSGFYADTADVESKVYEDDVLQIAADATYHAALQTPAFAGYHIDMPGSLVRATNCWMQPPQKSMFPVWFLSYRNRDRVAYATVNGQSGKTSVDLPVSIGKFVLGSLILAAAIFILLFLAPAIRPSVLLGFSVFFAIASVVLFNLELNTIIRRDSGFEDRGRFHGQIPPEANPGSKKKASKKKPVKGKWNPFKNHGCLTVVSLAFLGIYFLFTVGSFMADLINTSYGKAIFWIIMLIVTVACYYASRKKIKQLELGRHMGGSEWAVLAAIAAGVIEIVNPVSDIIYYAAALFSLAAICISLVRLIRFYNISATRRLPQFDLYKGGDDR